MSSRKTNFNIESTIAQYLKIRDWSQLKKKQRVRSILTQFHRWLDLKGHSLDEISLKKIDLFIDWNKRSQLKKKVRREYTWVVLNYLIWLSYTQIYKVSHLVEMVPNLEYLSYRNYGSLPSYTEEYLQIVTKRYKRARAVLVRTTLTQLYFCIEYSHDAKYTSLKKDYIIHFLSDLESKNHVYWVSRSKKIVLRKYLEWLESQNLIQFEFRDLFPRASYERFRFIEKESQIFLNQIKATMRPSTYSHYRHALSLFHEYLHKEKVKLRTIKREHIESWISLIRLNPLSNQYRRHLIIELRIYLNWLYEHGYIDVDPISWIKPKDIPRRSKGLPRPLPPEIDIEIQRRLQASENIYHQGLLLMRRTGIRIGELHNLTYKCIRKDPTGGQYLKVELGKMKSERLVPIDDHITSLILKIQNKSLEYWRTKNLCQSEVPKLIIDPSGSIPKYNQFFIAYREIRNGLQSSEPLVPHRARHTYATELLSAGMNITSIMRILGHRNITSTLRYADVVQTTVQEEYQSAIKTIQQKYKIQTPSERQPQASSAQPLSVSLGDTIRILLRDKVNYKKGEQRKLSLIIKRLRRLQLELDHLNLLNQ